MTAADARAVLAHQSGGKLEVRGVEFASDLVALICTVERPPPSVVWPDGLARFPVRMNRALWEAVKVLVEHQFSQGANRC